MTCEYYEVVSPVSVPRTESSMIQHFDDQVNVECIHNWRDLVGLLVSFHGIGKKKEEW